MSRDTYSRLTSPDCSSSWLSTRTPRWRSIVWPSKVKFTSSMPWRSAQAPNCGLRARRAAAEQDAIVSVHVCVSRVCDHSIRHEHARPPVSRRGIDRRLLPRLQDRSHAHRGRRGRRRPADPRGLRLLPQRAQLPRRRPDRRAVGRRRPGTGRPRRAPERAARIARPPRPARGPRGSHPDPAASRFPSSANAKGQVRR